MRLNAFLALAVLTAAAVAVSLGPAQANFAAARGFSGQFGATCVSCHTAPPVLATEAQALLVGLPEAWDPGATYALTVQVVGGPVALPAPAPQGGFEISANLGRFGKGDGMQGLLAQHSPKEMTYTPEGTLRREWTMSWTAPDLATQPATATVWLAVLSANGNHNAQLNISDGGERLDAAASLVVAVPPSAAAHAAWNALPLAAPTLRPVREVGSEWSVTGEHRDANATGVAWRVDGGPWSEKQTGPTWAVAAPQGAGLLEVRSAGSGRVSPVQAVDLPSDGPLDALGPSKGSPAPAAAVLALALVLCAFLAATTRSRTP